MQISSTGLDLIEQSEGFRSSVYDDIAGLATIGYGHRVLPGESFPGPITEAQAEALLQADVATAEQAVNRLVTVPLTQEQFDALVDFVFNLGPGNFASSTLLKDLNAGQMDAAAQQILIWDHSLGQVNAGLKARREAEFRMFTSAQATQATTQP